MWPTCRAFSGDNVNLMSASTTTRAIEHVRVDTRGASHLARVPAFDTHSRTSQGKTVSHKRSRSHKHTWFMVVVFPSLFFTQFSLFPPLFLLASQLLCSFEHWGSSWFLMVPQGSSGFMWPVPCCNRFLGHDWNIITILQCFFYPPMCWENAKRSRAPQGIWLDLWCQLLLLDV